MAFVTLRQSHYDHKIFTVNFFYNSYICSFIRVLRLIKSFSVAVFTYLSY